MLNESIIQLQTVLTFGPVSTFAVAVALAWGGTVIGLLRSINW